MTSPSPNRLPAGNASGCPAEGNPATDNSLDARCFVIPGEDPAGFEALVREYREQFLPAGPVERFLVDTLIQCDWKKRRLTRAENQFLRLIARTLTGSSELLRAAYESGGPHSGALHSLFRLQAANERSYFRAITELRRLQQQRQPAQPGREAFDPQHHPQTGGIGFVPKSAPPEPAPPEHPAAPIVLNLGKGHPPEGLVFVG